VDPSPEASAVHVSQAVHLRKADLVTHRDIRTRISVRISSSFRGSTSSSSSSIVSTASREVTSIRGRTTRRLAFLPRNKSEQPSSPSTRRRQRMFPLWRSRPLGDAVPKEDGAAADQPQCSNKARCTAAVSR
jgi:hypothetical protein